MVERVGIVGVPPLAVIAELNRRGDVIVDLDEPHAIGKSIRQPRRDGERDAGLSDAAWPHDRHEASIEYLVGDAVDHG